VGNWRSYSPRLTQCKRGHCTTAGVVTHLDLPLKTKRSRCARCNGVTIPRKKLHGKEKKSRRQSFQVSLSIRPNLGDEIHFKGGRFVTH
jgi:hypothetical protein